ncbi:MAG: hypothetical protein K6A61_12125 [Butyrivibrio sp.]|nr:hypothetical protein [Butyrivibrio sp.]
MRFNKNVPQALQAILVEQLNEYEHSFKDMSKEERKLLHEWVKNGNSPYENGDYVCDDNCQPMDFVNTLRFWEDMREYSDSLSEEEKIKFCGKNSVPDLITECNSNEDGFQISLELMKKIENEVTFL